MTEQAGRLRRWRFRSSMDATTLTGYPSLIAKLLAARGLNEPDMARSFIAPNLRDLADPANLPGMDRAAQRICRAITDSESIVIYGDYDVDGITASAILYHTLRQLNANVATYIPHRLDEGYGLNVEAIQQLASNHSLIISVDCGITATEPARVARELGVDLIITDHHQFDPDDLPDACVLVHPELQTPADDPHNPPLCGAGVAFKLAWHIMRLHCGSDRLPGELRGLMMDLLSLAALGTIADVVALRGENRLLVVFGLQRIKQTRFPGLNALIDAAKLRDETIDSYHVGFVLGPRLNACGRMGHAEQALRLLTNITSDEAPDLAVRLTKVNDQRRTTERTILEQAKQMVEQADYHHDDRRALVLAHRDWHLGVVGIVASRLVETFGRPTVMLCIDEQGLARGSARSVEGVCLHTALTTCTEHLEKFGGHAMAAGLTLKADRIEMFRDAFIQHVNEQLSVDQLTAQLTLDAEICLADCEIGLYDQIYKLAPFGRSNPSPRLLLRRVTLDRPAQRIGKSGQHLSLYLRQGTTRTRAVAFGMGELADELPAGVVVDLVFSPKINVWQGRRRAELHVQDFRMVNEPAAVGV